MADKTVAILFHENDRRDRYKDYMISEYAGFWQERGLRVVNVFGVREFVPADLAIVHINLTVVPRKYVDFANRYPRTLNAGVTDIRKSTFSRIILDQDDGFDGEVIVKSDLNYYGKPEWRSRSLPEKIAHALSLPGPLGKRTRQPVDYKVYRNLSEVPQEDRGDPGIVVEKFLPEREDGHFFVRTHLFLGSHATSFRLRSKDPIVKFNNIVDFDVVDPHPDVIETTRQMNIDFGKIDYVVHEGNAFVYDVNKTPSGGGKGLRDNQSISDMRKYRSEGLYDYLDDPEA